MSKNIKINSAAIATTVVVKENTAKVMHSGDLDVFATPAMCALMEEAAKTAVAPFLEEGEGTVGISLSITHDAPSALGANITALAKVIAVDGRKITFTIEAHDGDKKIGNGTHERFIINNEKFMAKLQK